MPQEIVCISVDDAFGRQRRLQPPASDWTAGLIAETLDAVGRGLVFQRRHAIGENISCEPAGASSLSSHFSPPAVTSPPSRGPRARVLSQTKHFLEHRCRTKWGWRAGRGKGVGELLTGVLPPRSVCFLKLFLSRANMAHTTSALVSRLPGPH